MMANRCEWTLILRNPLLSKERVESCEHELQKMLADPWLTIKRAKAGSTVVIIESSADGFDRIQGLTKNQKDVHIDGIVIQEVVSNSIYLDPVHQIPSDEDFKHSMHPLPPPLLLPHNLPIEIPSIEEAHMSEIHKEQMRQAKLSFNMALPLGVIGILVAMWGAISWSTSMGKRYVGIGAIMEVLTFILSKFPNEMNRRLDETQKEVRSCHRLERVYRKLWGIGDSSKRDEAIFRLLMTALKQTLPLSAKRKIKKSDIRSD